MLSCHDCKKVIRTKKYHTYPVNVSSDPKQEFVKCLKCFKKDPLLRNFRLTEVYSRVVGYIRPLSQWNKGKREEHKDKKYFKLKK